MHLLRAPPRLIQDDYEFIPGKVEDSMAGTYTFTTSKIMHPTDIFGTSTPSGPSRPSTTATPLTPHAPCSVQPIRPTHQATSTFSMSHNLAASLGERGVTPSTVTSSMLQNQPPRFNQIVTETRCLTNSSQTQGAYSSSSMFLRPIEGIDASSAAVAYQPQDAFLSLTSRMGDIGLNSIMDIAGRSGLAPVKLDPVDVGLNTIMSIKRNKGAINRVGVSPRKISTSKKRAPTVMTRSTPLSQSTVTTTVSFSCSHLGYASMPLPSTTKLTVTSTSCLTVTSSVRSKPVVSSPRMCPRPSSLKLKPIIDETPVSTEAGDASASWGLGWITSNLGTLVRTRNEDSGSAL
ncbi:hypothetical protein CAPTEDRAFT_217631 [Capitella teleta]|uniref:Uncharacterized protein n=1 Tax=Capitella teleta TaxID=283909 RepID=X2AMH1_CAPTE|nr:hypothetical protein CAPTEDRAFT_217631 [Capitella teleta]|eukprot:ELU00244.1 hypothetical protein CAPTEDRAFT_217631 [Capitella teleta]